MDDLLWALLPVLGAVSGFALARRIAPRRPRTAAGWLDLAIGVRAIARELGVSRREAWTMIRSGAVDTYDLGGAPCAARADLRSWRRSRS